MAGTFGDLLRRHRRAAGLSQFALADAAGLSEQAVGHLERGVRRRPHTTTVLALTAALGLSREAGAVLMAAARGGSVPAPEAISYRRQLPAAVPDFVGRSDELGQLAEELRTASAPGGRFLVALHGPAGVGKTTLAIRAAHLAGDQFVDGQLYLDLRGYGPAEPMTAAAALTVLLTSLGVARNAVPASVEVAAAQYRSLLAGTRTLVVLDNASDAETLQPLLPSVAGCAVLVTGRRMLDPASIEVRPLDETYGLELLEQIIGSPRMNAELESARRIVRTAHGLPLIVRLVGARLDSRAAWQLTAVAAQFEEQGIDQLDVAEAVDTAVATSLDSLRQSADATEQRAATAFDYLGLLDADELSEAAVGALLGQPAADVMIPLADLHLVGSPRPGTYRLHDLLRSVSAERAIENLALDVRRQALRRVVGLYLAAAWECQALTHPSSERLQFAKAPIGSLDPDDLPERLAWLDGESAVITALVEQLATLDDFRDLLLELGFALFGYLELRGRWPELRRVAGLCLTAAATLEQRAWFQYQAAIPDWEQGRLTDALRGFEAALALSDELGDARSVARSAFALASTLGRLDRIDEAVHFARRSIASAEESGYPQGLGSGLLALGGLQARRGNVEEAESSFGRAIGLALEAGELRTAARRHDNAGDAYAAAGLHQQAIVHLQAALELFDESTDANGASFAYRQLGTCLLACDRVDEAEAALNAALRLTRETKDGGDEARTLVELAEVHLRRGEDETATGELTAALALFEDLGLPEADEVRERLDMK